MNGLGLQIHNTRIQRYLSTLDEMIALPASERDVHSDQDNQRFRNTLFEVGELAQIYRAFKDSELVGLQNRISVISQGLDSYYEGTPRTNTSSRDLLFELLMASRFVLSGQTVALNVTDDVTWIHDGESISVQCKRCKTIRSIARNIHDAAKQIICDKNDDSLNVTRGIIALDLTAVINPTFHLFKGKTQHAMENQIRYDLNLTIRNHIDNWRSINSGADAFLIRFSAVGQVMNTGDAAYAQYYSLWPIVQSTAVDALSNSF